MVDNFDLIRNNFEVKEDRLFTTLRELQKEYYFYFVQIIKRRKENPDMPRYCKLLKTFYVSDFEQLDNLKSYIVDMCQHERARAYIHLNRRDFHKVGLMCIKDIAELLATGQDNAIPNAYNSACGKYGSEPDKTWIVDVDTKDEQFVKECEEFIETLQPLGKLKVKCRIPTVNGFHIIARPFNQKQFKEKYKDIDIHKDNPTVLYAPDF